MLNEKNQLPPSHPFNEALCEMAADMKSAGLIWTPRVGDFVWDNRKVINHPSPFPNRIYFILNIRRFLDIFHTVDNMTNQLVWLPAWHQARAVCTELNINDNVIKETFCSQGDFEAGNDLNTLYKVIFSALDKS